MVFNYEMQCGNIIENFTPPLNYGKCDNNSIDGLLTIFKNVI